MRPRAIATSVQRLLIAGSLLACLVPAHAAQPAGEVVKIAGRASAATQEGDIRALQQGNGVNTGDTVVTSPNSFLRMKLSDGGYVVLRPNTRFQIEDYNLADNPADNRSVFNLLKGGFRAVTGLIGQRNRANVSFRTAVATIGIRGTDLEVIDCTDGCPDLGTNPTPGIYFRVHQGGIDVGNTPFEQGHGGFSGGAGEPTIEVDVTDPEFPPNVDPTPAANPEDCL